MTFRETEDVGYVWQELDEERARYVITNTSAPCRLRFRQRGNAGSVPRESARGQSSASVFIELPRFSFIAQAARNAEGVELLLSSLSITLRWHNIVAWDLEEIFPWSFPPRRESWKRRADSSSRDSGSGRSWSLFPEFPSFFFPSRARPTLESGESTQSRQLSGSRCLMNSRRGLNPPVALRSAI